MRHASQVGWEMYINIAEKKVFWKGLFLTLEEAGKERTRIIHEPIVHARRKRGRLTGVSVPWSTDEARR